jgi:hypothetical protein
MNDSRQEQPKEESDLITSALDRLEKLILSSANGMVDQIKAVRTEYEMSKKGALKADAVALLNGQGWKKFSQSNGEWTFMTDPNDVLLKELEPLKDFIEELRKAGDPGIVVDDHKYRISKGKFLNRFPVGK